MNNGNGKSYTHINSFREGLTNATNGHGSGQINELLHNITSLRRGILDMVSDKRRNLDHDFGWPSTGALNPEAYRDLYDRDAIANRVVNLMPKECWQVTPEVYEREKGQVATPFEKSWRALNESVAGSSWHGGEKGTAVFAKLKLLDIMSGIGSFGIMLIGLDDGKRLDEPAEGVVEKVVSGMAFNAQNRIVDSWMTEEEEKKLKAWDGKEKRPKPLSNDEVIAVNAWARQRDMLHHAVAKVEEETRNQRVANLRPDDGANNPRSPKNMFSSYDTSQTQAQQWFGTQFGEPEKLAEKPGTTERKVTFLRVFDESAIQVTRWEASVLSPRFGQPVIYRVTFNDPRDQSGGSLGMPSTTAFVHWSRVIHVPSDERGSNDAIGNSRLKAVINDVLDIRKVRGSSPEGYYQSCFPILAFETHPQLGDDVDVDMTDLRNQVENLVNSLQRSLLGKGGSWKTLPPAVVDPTPHVTAGIEAICIQKSCPVRIFKGSERGELASSQDDSQWNDRIRERQNGHVTPVIIVPFIDRLILMGVLEAPEKPGENPRVPADELPPNDQAMDANVPAEEQDAEEGQPVAKKPITNRKRWVWNTRTNRIQLVNAAPPFPPAKPKTPPTPVEGADDPSTQDDDPMAEGSLDEADQLEGENPNEVTIDQEPGYKIDWPDLDSLGDMDRATIANTLTQALGAYVQSGAADFMPPFEYFTQVWQMDDDEAAMVVTAMEKHQEEVKLEQEEEQAMLAEEQGFAPEAPEGFIDPEQRDMDHEVALAAAENPAGAAKPPGGGFPPKGGKQPPAFGGKKPPPVGNAEQMDGQWVTTDEGQHIFISAGGSVEPSGPAKGEAKSKSTSVDVRKKVSSKDSKMKLSNDEAEAFETYISSEYDSINTFLRNGDLPAHHKEPKVSAAYEKNQRKRVEDTIKGVDKIMAKAKPLEEETTFYRGIGGQMAETYKAAQPGDVFDEKNYLSTSTTGDDAEQWGRYSNQGTKSTAVLHLTVEKGIKGVYSSAMSKLSSDITDKNEDEFLIERGLRMVVDRVDGNKVYATLKKGKPPIGNAATLEDVVNVFCATGPGGGVDPSCGTSEGGKVKAMAAALDRYKRVGGEVDGRRVLKNIDNVDSIGASLYDYRTLPGIREVNVADFPSLSGRSYSASETKRIKDLADRISASKKISPLIVVEDGDPDGPYILEGGHRAEALFSLKAKSFPALVVLDKEAIRKRIKDGSLASRLGNPTTVADVENVFCPTGDEGGVDPTCSPGGSAAAAGGKGEADKGQHGDFSETTKESGPIAIHAKAKDADAFARENIENATLTPEQSEAVESYRTTRDCYDINNHLRGTGPITQTWKTKLFGLSAKQQAAMENLDKVIAGSRTKADMVVMRGFGIDKGNGFGAPQTVDSLFKPGSTFTDNGFMSTTLASEVAERFSTKGGYVDDDRVIMHIEVPKGSNGYYMPRKPGAYDEAEMVMPRGSRFTVSKVEKIDKHMYKVHVKHIGVKSNGSTK